MNDHIDSTFDDSTDSPPVGGDPAPLGRLLTPAEAAHATGLSRKQITGRMDRGSLRVVKDDQGTRRVPKTELVRVGLLAQDGSPSHPAESLSESGDSAGELVIWRDLYERERQDREQDRAAYEQLRDRERDLTAQLAAIANAGPIRAARLRKQLREQLADV